MWYNSNMFIKKLIVRLRMWYADMRGHHYENKKWNNRFFSFWNWLWMKHFKAKEKK